VLRRPAGFGVRHFSASIEKLHKVVGDELAHEMKEYSAPEVLTKLHQSDPDWKFESVEGSVMMRLTKDAANGKEIKIEWQLTQPYDPEVEEHEQEHFEPTDFAIYIKDKQSTAGMVLYCSTARGESHRFVIGNIQCVKDVSNAQTDEAYSGPDFEDLDERLQDAIDDVLGELGVNEAVCDFLDATAVDKEQSEYINWLQEMKTFWK
jgi:hypothetical protein